MCEVKPLCQNEVSNIGKHFGKKNLHVKQIYPIKSYSFWHKEEKKLCFTFFAKNSENFSNPKTSRSHFPDSSFSKSKECLSAIFISNHLVSAFLLESPMLMDPYLSQQHVGLNYTKFCPIGTRTRGTRQTGNGSTKEFCSKPSLNDKKMVEDNHIKIKRM